MKDGLLTCWASCLARLRPVSPAPRIMTSKRSQLSAVSAILLSEVTLASFSADALHCLMLLKYG